MMKIIREAGARSGSGNGSVRFEVTVSKFKGNASQLAYEVGACSTAGGRAAPQNREEGRSDHGVRAQHNSLGGFVVKLGSLLHAWLVL